jgi:hypothetical protein
MRASLTCPITLSELQTVECGKCVAKLSETQFALLSYLLSKQGKATFRELRERVWSRPVSDGAISGAGERLFNALSTSGILRTARKIIDVDASNGLIALKSY